MFCTAGANRCGDGGTRCAAPGVACTDTRDDDCDGTIDCDDIDCVSTPACSRCTAERTEEACTNGVDDDDYDGAADCVDPECRAAHSPSCFGDWAAELEHDSGGGGGTAYNALKVELTASGLRTRGPDGFELTMNGSAATILGGHDLAALSNGYLRTCETCPIRRGAQTFFPRAGSLSATAALPAPGDPFDAVLADHWEEVELRADGEVYPVPGGATSYGVLFLHGVAVAGGVVGEGASSHISAESGAGAHASEPPGPTCGYGFCGNGETHASCPADCPLCDAATFTVECTGAYACSDGSACISRGRCACTTSPSRVSLVGFGCTSGVCHEGVCTGADWICVATGCGNPFCDTVACPGGTTCPPGSTCGAGGGCDCQEREIPVRCDGSRCTGSGCVTGSWRCGTRPPAAGRVVGATVLGAIEATEKTWLS